MAGLDVSAPRGQTPIYAAEKAERLANRVPTPVQVVEQAGQLKNPDARVVFGDLQEFQLLANYADSYQGIGTSDNAQFLSCFWEYPFVSGEHRFVQVAPDTIGYVSGATSVLFWEDGKGRYYQHAMRLKSEGRLGGWKSGGEAWGKNGLAVSVTGTPTVSIYLGTMFDTTLAAIIPKDQNDLAAINEFLRWDGYIPLVRESDQALSITEHSLLKVPFDLAHWQAVAAEKYPNGLPKPHSDDPTQWLFKGDIATSTDPLQVAVARLVGYRWPDQPKEDAVVDPFVDDDGIVCLPGVRHEAPAAERLADLLRAVGYKIEVDLATWLRDKFFEEHSKRFHQRPFIWHIWDGRKDGFAALVNYHKLTHKTLENLTYSYLGDWISAQSKSDKAGADLRLAAAQALQEKLKLILAGEPPYDIFVRWKPLHEQAVGWHPDLNDGVRMNIRPFVEADILRKTPNIKWTKDRGKEPERDKHDYPWFWSGSEFVGDRLNDVHLTNEKKTAAQSRKKGAK
jgi:hypothetical protein